MDGIILSMSQINLSTVLSFAYSSGTVEFRDRFSMKVVEADDDYRKVSSLRQIGLSFINDEPCKYGLLQHLIPPFFYLRIDSEAGLHIAISPNLCCAVALSADSKVKLKMMGHRAGMLDSTDNRTQHPLH